MVLLTTTPQILQILSSLSPSVRSTLSSTTSSGPDTPKDTNNSTTFSTADTTPLPTSTSSPISHKTLIALSRLPNSNKNVSIPPLNTLLQGTKPYTPPPQPKPTPSAEYTALMARLREEQEQREYEALVAPRQRRSSLSDLMGSTNRESNQNRERDEKDEEDNISPSLVLNILLSVVMCAFGTFHLTQWWPNDGVRVLMSLGVGIVVGIAEVGVYSIYLFKVGEAKKKERGKKERKVFLGQFVGGDGSGIDAKGFGKDGKEVVVVGMGEKEEIWGRGVNGGMRRRVREKWEKEQAETTKVEEEKEK